MKNGKEVRSLTDRFGKFIDPADISRMILFNLEEFQEDLTTWSALLQDLLVHPHNREIRRSEGKGNKCPPKNNVNYDYSIQWKQMTLHQIKSLIIIARFSQNSELLESLTTLANEKLMKNPDIEIYLHSYIHYTKSELICLLDNSLLSKDSFFGQLREMLLRIRKEVEVYDSINEGTIFRVPFWREQPPFPRSKKYTGWARHQKDHGTMRSDDHGFREILNDEAYQTEMAERAMKIKASYQDSKDFLYGFIY